MILLRSLLFNSAFYMNFLLFAVLCLPSLLLPRRYAMACVKLWASSSLWLLRVIAGIRFRLEGKAHITSGPLLVASKHQSAWETFALLTVFEDPVFILKRELMWLPLLGWYGIKTDMIAVDRDGGAKAMRTMTEKARQAMAEGRQLILFPEGTRRAVGAPPDYKSGVVFLFDQLKVNCLPVALNSGLFWGRRSFMRYPGTIIVELLEVIPATTDRKQFLAILIERIETASQRSATSGLDRQSVQHDD